MCFTDIFTYIYADRSHKQQSRLWTCGYSSPGQPCARHLFIHHPIKHVPHRQDASYVTDEYRSAPSTPSGSYRSGADGRHQYARNPRMVERSSGASVNDRKDLKYCDRHQEQIALVDDQRRREENRQEENGRRIRERIEEANREIASRDPVPFPPGHFAAYKRPSVRFEFTDSAALDEDLRRLYFEEERREDKARRLAGREEEEEEAQRERLRERMQLKRPAIRGSKSGQRRYTRHQSTATSKRE